jgi:hypothetical protein
LEPTIGIKYTYSKKKVRPTTALGFITNIQLNTKATQILESVQNGISTTSEDSVSPMANMLYGGYIQFGCDYQIVNGVSIFTNVRYNLTISNMGYLHGFNLSCGFYL